MSTSYSVAVLADIHGNFFALEAVLEDLKQHKVDEIVFAGDLVMNGPRPKESITTIRSVQARSVIGNTDLEVVTNNDIVGQWTRGQLDNDDIAYLENLPVIEHICPPNGVSPQDNLLIVHSTPRDPFDLLILEPHPLGTTFTNITPIQEAIQMIQNHKANLMVYGHIHYYSCKTIRGQRIASLGSVGFPFDGDHRAAYTIVTWNVNQWECIEYRVCYDHEHVARELETSTIPFPLRYAKMIREANWLPRAQ